MTGIATLRNLLEKSETALNSELAFTLELFRGVQWRHLNTATEQDISGSPRKGCAGIQLELTDRSRGGNRLSGGLAGARCGSRCRGDHDLLLFRFEIDQTRRFAAESVPCRYGPEGRRHHRQCPWSDGPSGLRCCHRTRDQHQPGRKSWACGSLDYSPSWCLWLCSEP